MYVTAAYMVCVIIFFMRDNTGFSLVVKGSGVFTTRMIWISRGIVMISTGNPFWKLFDQAYLYALLKICAFHLLFCVFAKQNLYIECGVSFWVWVIYSKQFQLLH